VGVVAPSGTVTFLFTDIEGSTRLWETAPDAMGAALERHDEILRHHIDAHDGFVFATGGDGFAAAFARAGDALDAARAAQAALVAERWPADAAVRVRMGLHTGETVERDGDYFGPAVNQTARLMAVAHGGQVVCSQVTAAVAGDTSPLVDLGEHRLRDLTAPQRIFQLGNDPFPSLRSLDALPGNLPSMASSFVGRHDELAAVTKALGAHRLVTVTGVGGVGKTRLALQVAAELAPGLAEGAWLCELAAASTAGEMAQVVATALGVVPRPHMTVVESIVDFLRPRQALVVLDNCEHLLDPAAELADAVLAGAPRVRMLATSREGLAIAGEHLWPLRSLPVDDTEASDAVILFAERAQAVAPNFALADTNRDAVVEVCRRLDGIPLAIELAAARVGAMSPADIAGHLDERFRLLTGGRRGRVERHQTLRAAIEWSYSLLSDIERTVFGRLGVFPASFDETAAIAVAAGDDVQRWDVIDNLATLVAKSMVGAEPSADTTRYQLLETLRHFARDQATAAGHIDDLRRRHAAHYAVVAEASAAHMHSADEAQWRPRLVAELSNFRAAAGWAFDAARLDDVALGVQVVGSLLDAGHAHPSWGMERWAEAVLPRVEELSAEPRAIVLAASALDAHRRGAFELAGALGARVIAEAERYEAAQHAAFTAASQASSALSDPDGAIALLGDVRGRLRVEDSDEGRKAVFHVNACFIYLGAGDTPAAREEAQHALRHARKLQIPSLLSYALLAHAFSVADLDPDDALGAVEESIGLIEAKAASDAGYASMLQLAALLRSATGDTVGAARAVHTGVQYQARIGGSLSASANLVAATVLVLAAQPDAHHAAATLAGALTGPVFGHIRLLLRGVDRDRYEGSVAAIAAAVGPEVYTVAQQHGATMTYDEIITFTLEQLAPLAMPVLQPDDDRRASEPGMGR